MSNLPPNPFNNIPGQPPMNANAGPQVFNHNQQFGQVPLDQLPPGYGGLKQDGNSNSPQTTPVMHNSVLQNVNNYNQSASSSPAFNQPGTLPPTSHPGMQAIMRPAMSQPASSKSNLPPNVPLSSASPSTVPNINPSNAYPPNYQQQINDNAPPLVPSSQVNQSLVNGPPTSAPLGNMSSSPYPPSSRAFSPPAMMNRPPTSAPGFIPTSVNPPGQLHSVSKAGPMLSQSGTMPGLPACGAPAYGGPQGLFNGPQMGPPVSRSPMSPPNVPGSNHPPNSMQSMSGPPVSGAMLSGPPRNGPLGQPTNQPGTLGSNLGPPGHPQGSVGGPLGLPGGSHGFTSGSSGPLGPPSGPLGSHSGSVGAPSGSIVPPSGPLHPPSSPLGPPSGLLGPASPPSGLLGPPSRPLGPPSGPIGPPSGPLGPPSGPIGPPSGPLGPPGGPLGPPSGPLSHPSGPLSHPSGPIGPPNSSIRPPSGPFGPPSGPPTSIPNPPGPSNYPGSYSGPQSLPPMSTQAMPPMAQMGPPIGAPGAKSNMQNRYPQMPPSSYANHQPPQMPPQPMAKQYPQQYSSQGVTQQMSQLSVTKQGYDQLWGHHAVDLMQCKHILPEYPEDPPEIRLGRQEFADAPNCSPEIFRCTLNRIPETNSLLQKSRLPLGILIHPFKDLNHLPVIQCTTIVRCRACRTYINPFVYFVDAKRWKCNLCYRVNDLPEEFQYDPVSKSYGDPSRRPEIKSATIEFIAPGEYMLRPPQPAVYLFLFDVSQLARDSGYLQVACDTLKANLDQLPGDARTQIGFICYDSHVHYYLMSEGLTRPKEMTVLDIDDVFLPSPESLLVNLGERRELVKELLTVLPQRYSNPGVPVSALGAALQAAYKLMAPTGGRITVFQTCLPNIGPGALQPREDPNARSGKDVAHLNPATDFYKRIALDCSGAQVAVDLFLLNSQYSDLATLSGMSKFSAGTVYHMPLFRASRNWQASQLQKVFTRYLTRKIGFEAVMRVRCTRGISIHTFHGNFFVRSTDLLSLPNVSPDAGFGMQLTIEESLADLQQVCFQAALLYTSSKGERRIRVHTLALPTASNLTEVLHAADQQCIIGLVSKMGVDRSVTASLGEAREALSNVCVDALSAHRLAQNLPPGASSAALHAPRGLRLLPLYLSALLKTKAFRTGTSTRLDDRVAYMCALKCLPLSELLRGVYPALYALHTLRDHAPAHAAARTDDDDDNAPDPPRLQLSAERISSNGAYLLDDGESMVIYVCQNVSPAFLSETFGVAAFSQLPDEARSLPAIDSEGNQLLHAFIERLNDDRPYASDLLILRDNSPSRQLFTERLVDDRVESAFSYYEFLQHIKSQVK